MTYQDKPKLAERKRIRSVLQHQEWLEKEHDEPLDLTHLSNTPPLSIGSSLNSTTSWLSELEDSEKQFLYDRLAQLELIFWSQGEDVLDKILTDKNSQIINGQYEWVIENRHITKHTSPNFEKAAA